MSKLRLTFLLLALTVSVSAPLFANDDHKGAPSPKDNMRKGAEPTGAVRNAMIALEEIKKSRELFQSMGERRWIGAIPHPEDSTKELTPAYLNEENGQTKLNEKTCKITGQYATHVKQIESKNDANSFSGTIPKMEDAEALELAVLPQIPGKRVYAHASFAPKTEFGQPTAASCLHHWRQGLPEDKESIDNYANGDFKTNPGYSLWDPTMETFCINAVPIKGGIMCSIIATFPGKDEKPAEGKQTASLDGDSTDVGAPNSRGASAGGSAGSAAGAQAGGDTQPLDGDNPNPEGPADTSRRSAGNSTTPQATPVEPFAGFNSQGQNPSARSSLFLPENINTIVKDDGSIPTLDQMNREGQTPLGALGRDFGNIGGQLAAKDGDNFLPLAFDDQDPTRLIDNDGNDVSPEVMARTFEYYRIAMANNWLTQQEIQQVQPFMSRFEQLAQNGGLGGQGGQGFPGGGPSDLPFDPNMTGGDMGAGIVYPGAGAGAGPINIPGPGHSPAEER